MLSYFIFFPPHLCRLYTSNSGIFILMMQTKAERFFFYFGKCCFFFFCVVSDGKKKKHMSTIGSSTGGLFFFFFFAEIADGDTCSGWRDTDLKGPRWSFKVTVATYCSACVCVYLCVCQTTCRWNKCVKTQVQGKSQRTSAPTQHLHRHHHLLQPLPPPPRMLCHQ